MGSKRTAEQATRATLDGAGEPHATALSEVEHDTAGRQERLRSLKPRQAPGMGGADMLSSPPKDTRTQAEKFADAAREHGADESEDAFKGVLRKLAKPRS